jgi:hypothetical protein
MFIETQAISLLSSWGVGLDCPILWLSFPHGRLDSEGVGELRRLFAGASDLYVWHATDGGAASQSIKSHKRAFGAWSQLNRAVVARADLLHEEVRYFCDIARVTEAAEHEVALLAQSTVWGKHSGLFFAAHEIREVPSELVQLCRHHLSRGEKKGPEAENLLRRYLTASKAAATTPLLVAADSNLRQYIVAPATGSAPYEDKEMVTRENFESWLQPGIGLRLLS